MMDSGTLKPWCIHYYTYAYFIPSRYIELQVNEILLKVNYIDLIREEKSQLDIS